MYLIFFISFLISFNIHTYRQSSMILRPLTTHMTLWWNLRGTYWYLNSNRQYLVNYGWRYQRGMPISSSIAESAVNEVVSLRCAKKRQMRWTNQGAHLLVQVRVAVLNGELKMRDKPKPRRFHCEHRHGGDRQCLA